MNLISDPTVLDAYMGEPEFAPKVRKASDFRAQVHRRFTHKESGEKHPSILLGKASGIEFRPAEVTAWVGFNGHRKSMFTSQVALDLAVQKQRVLMVSLEMEPTTTIERMLKQAAGAALPSARKIDRFHDWTDDRIWLFDHMGNLSVDHTFALCRYFAEALQGTHVFLDSMMMICASEEKMDEQKRFSTGLVRLAQETGLHVHIVTHCRKPSAGGEERLPTRYEIRGSAAISDQAHNVMIVWMNKAKYAKLEANPGDVTALIEPCAVVKCDKQRNGRWEGKVQLWNDEASLRFCEDRINPVMPYHFLEGVA